jgi:hypothetical protein
MGKRGRLYGTRLGQVRGHRHGESATLTDTRYHALYTSPPDVRQPYDEVYRHSTMRHVLQIGQNEPVQAALEIE